MRPLTPRLLALALASWGCGDSATGAMLGGAKSVDAGEGPRTSEDASRAAPAADAATGEAPTPAADGGSTGAPAAPPTCKDLPICDDFEATAPGGAPSASLWSIVTPNCSGAGAIAIDGAVAHGGARSVKVSGAGGYCDHVFFTSTRPVAAIGAHVWGRFFVRFEQALGAGHATFLAMKDAEDGKDLRMGGQNQVLMWNRESDDATLPSMSPAGTAKSVAPRTSAWTCVELEVDGDAGTLHTWVDGVAIEGMTAVPPGTPDVSAPWLSKKQGWRPSLTDLKLGWESYAGQAETLWFDDVAFGAQRIGCVG